MLSAEQEALRATRDISTAKTIAEHLEKHYPRYGWMVNASEENGVVRVHSLRLSGKYGFLVKYTDFQDDPSLRIITKLGGETLERFRVNVGKAIDDQLHDKKTVAGEFGFDYHEMKNAKVTDAVRMRWDFFK
jgi:hypothetical protein